MRRRYAALSLLFGLSCFAVFSAKCFAETRAELYRQAIQQVDPFYQSGSADRQIYGALREMIKLQLKDLKYEAVSDSALDIPDFHAEPNFDATPRSRILRSIRKAQALRQQLEKRRASTPGDESISFITNRTAFWGIILDYLQGFPAQESLNKLHAFSRTKPGSTGADGTGNPLALAEASMYLDIKDWTGATAALADNLEANPFKGEPLLKQLLGTLDEPWQDIYLGIAANPEAYQSIGTLAGEGGEAAAEGLLELFRLNSDPRAKQRYGAALGSFLPAECKKTISNISTSHEIARTARVRQNISAQTQSEIVSALAAFGSTVTTVEDAAFLAKAFARSCSKELLRAAEHISELPFVEPRRQLEPMLAQYGVTPNGRGLSREVAIVLTARNFPVTGIEIEWESNGDCSDSEDCAKWQQSADLDGEGKFTILRDELVPGGFLKITPGDRYRTKLPYFFRTRLKLPNPIPDTLQFPLSGGALAIEFEGDSVAAGGERRVLLQSETKNPWELPNEGALGEWLDADHVFAADAEVGFGVVPADRYKVCVSAPGWSEVCKEHVAIAEGQNTMLRLRPERGADVRFRAVSDGSEIETREISWSFIGSDNRIYYPWRREARGLPLGDYVLQLGPREEIPWGAKKGSQLPAALKREVKPHRIFSVQQIRFSIDESSAGVIDLGDIVMQPVN